MFCGKNSNLALFDCNRVFISGSYHFKTHLTLFIHIIHCLSCKTTAYDLGLDTTICPEGCLGSTQYLAYLVKISDESWYRMEGVPLWQSMMISHFPYFSTPPMAAPIVPALESMHAMRAHTHHYF
jgi:hypothetical protein